MVLTYDQRVELLKKAREAKKAKKIAKDYAGSEPIDEEPTPEPEKPKKTRAKKVKEEKRTLDMKVPDPMPDFVDSEPEVEEQIIYKPKDKKKKKIIRKVIMEQSSDDEEVEVIEERVKAPKKEKSVPETPKYICPSKACFFNF
jgi:hypothetical protein